MEPRSGKLFDAFNIPETVNKIRNKLRQKEMHDGRV